MEVLIWMSVINANECKVWITSDLHFGHQKEFLYGPRGYDSNIQMMADVVERWNKKVDSMNDRQKLIRMYENLQQEIKTAENNILFFTGKSKSANKLVDDMQKKIDTLKAQLHDLEVKITQLDAEE